MENSNPQTPLIDNDGKLVDLSVSRNDIIDYIVEKEKEKLVLLNEDANLILEEKQKDVKEFKKNKVILISEKAKEINKVILDAYLDIYPDAEVIFEDFNNPSNRYMNEMFDRFGPCDIVGSPSSYGRPDYSYKRDDNQFLIITSNTNKNVIYGSIKVKIPEDFLKDLQNQFNTLEKEETIAYKEVINISSQIQELIHNRGKIKSKLVEQVLSNSEEGLKVLKSLENISFTDNKLKLD